jgi:D-alanine-D-alanine ligase
MTNDILVIHNAVDKAAIGKDKPVFKESNAGLEKEICAVTETLEVLGARYQVKSVETIEQLPEVLVHSSLKIVFNLVEELPGDILNACYVPALCRAHGRAFTGNDTPALMLAQNKWQAKAVLKAADVPSPAGTIVPVGQRIHRKDLPAGKYVVKPVFSDASEGINPDSVVELAGTALDKAVEQIHKRFKQPAIVEQFVPDRELNVSLLEQNGKVRAMPVAEIDFSAFGADKPRIVDYSAKWLEDSFAYNNTPRIIPAQLSKETADLVQQYALAAWHALGCQDYARVDFRLDHEERPFVLEVNPNPDISADDGFAAALTAGGLTYANFIETLLDNASRRIGRKN